MTELRVIPDVVCPGCGCACDDIEVQVQDDQIVGTRNLCDLGEEWFSTPPPQPCITIDGQPATLDEALAEAVRVLREARSPIVCGLRETTCETVRVAVRIADRLGAILDSTQWNGDNAATIAAQTVGDVTCSLGEIKNRADLIVLWHCNARVSHPRLNERYAADAEGLFVPNSRSDRTVVMVGDIADLNPDVHIAANAAYQFETLWTLRALVQGVFVEVQPPELRELAARMKSCHFGVLFYCPYSVSDHHDVEAMQHLAQDLNAFTRFYVVPLTAPGNPLGAQAVSTWQTGYPLAVNFNRGYPRSNPREFNMDWLTMRHEVDAALLVGAKLEMHLCDELARIPTIVIGSDVEVEAPIARVCITTARPGLQTHGTIYRMDDVSLPLRPVLPPDDLPTDLEVLTRLDQLLTGT